MRQSRTLWTAGVYNCDRLLSQTHKSLLISKSVFSFAPPPAVALGRPLPVFANISLKEQMDLKLFVHAGPFRQPEGVGIHTARYLSANEEWLSMICWSLLHAWWNVPRDDLMSHLWQVGWSSHKKNSRAQRDWLAHIAIYQLAQLLCKML